MYLYVVFGQRRENYPGELGPEAISVIDEFGHDENPTYIETERSEAAGSGDYENVVVARLDVSQDAIMTLLRPSTSTVVAHVVKD